MSEEEIRKECLDNAHWGSFNQKLLGTTCVPCMEYYNRRLHAENAALNARLSIHKSRADAASQRADEAHTERADVLLRLSAETSNRVFTDSEMVKLEIRAEAAEAKVAALTKERDEAQAEIEQLKAELLEVKEDREGEPL